MIRKLIEPFRKKKTKESKFVFDPNPGETKALFALMRTAEKMLEDRMKTRGDK